MIITSVEVAAVLRMLRVVRSPADPLSLWSGVWTQTLVSHAPSTEAFSKRCIMRDLVPTVQRALPVHVAAAVACDLHA